MQIYYATDYKDLSRKAANIISAQVILKRDSVLGLATGSSPVGVYEQLIDWYNKQDIDFSKCKTVNLDEYYGLAKENEQSYFYFMNDKFFKHININYDNIHIPNGLNTNEDEECEKYNKIIKDLGGIDLQLLGIGANGHIAFNEPGEAFEKETHCVDLKQETINSNKKFFKSGEEVPKKAYTLGIKNIMNAKKILLIATGQAKAEILYKALCGPVTPKVPASILQLHNDVTIVADKAALQVILDKKPEMIL